MKNIKNQLHREYLPIKDLAHYSGISERTLWELLKDPLNPIPFYRVGSAGRIIRVKKSEFDDWMKSQRQSQDDLVDKIVSEIL